MQAHDLQAKGKSWAGLVSKARTNSRKLWKLNQRQLERAVKQPAVVDKQAPGLNEKRVRAGASRLLCAGESTQARLMSRPQEQWDVTQLSQDRSKFPPAAAMQPVSRMGTFTARGLYLSWKPRSPGEWCRSGLWLRSRWQQKEHRMEEVEVLQTFIPANFKSWMEVLKQQLLCTDTLGRQFIWCLRLAEMDRAEWGLCIAQSWKSSTFYLDLLAKGQTHFRNMHPLMLMNVVHETKTITLANDFKGLRSSVWWNST